ncbi:MAG: acyl-CoA desaturase [Planctomycetaceae bacterium]
MSAALIESEASEMLAPVETMPETSSAGKMEAPVGGNSVKFGRSTGFMQTLRERVDAWFEEHQHTKRDHPRMYLKTVVILSWAILSYAGLVFWAASWPQALALAASLGIAMAAVGFNIQHDGGHGAYSRFPAVNQLMAFTLDILGGSSYIWKRTHNIIHHSYTNVTGIDGDIDLGVLGRLSPHQPRYGFHRLQHLYLWFLYGFITFKWQFHDDFQALLRGRIGETRVPRPQGLDLFLLILGKAMFVTLAFVIPLSLHAWYNVLGCFVAASFVQGLLLSIVFQLAHVVEHADFPLPDAESQKIENEWAVHQVETTVDFARDSWLATWFTGGLNFQIEHHLFPQICHIYYPELSRIVEATSKEFGVSYAAHPTTLSAVKSHYSLLKKLGRPHSETCPAT